LWPCAGLNPGQGTPYICAGTTWGSRRDLVIRGGLRFPSPLGTMRSPLRSALLDAGYIRVINTLATPCVRATPGALHGLVKIPSVERAGIGVERDTPE
jgi:hypothetical protein